MDYNFWSIFTDLDGLLRYFAQTYPHWVYAIIFINIFCETGLIVAPFLPGDSFIFLLGALAGSGLLEVWLVVVIVFLAAAIGDTTNFFIGRYVRNHAKSKKSWIKQEYIDKTEAFYKKYGGLTLIVARFTPYVRTYAPFVGGFSGMAYRKYIGYSLIGTAIWVGVLIPAGYLLGKNEFVVQHIGKVVLAIIFVVSLPMIIGIIKKLLTKNKVEKIVEPKTLDPKVAESKITETNG